jgi:hypothetical protein
MQGTKVTIKCSQCGGARKGKEDLDSLTPFLLYFESENMLEKFNSKVLNV